MAIAMILPLLITTLYFVVLSGGHPVAQRSAAVVGKSIQFLLPLVWVGWICRQRLVWPAPTWRGLFGGFGFGLLVLVAMVGFYQQVLLPRGVFVTAAGEIRTKLTELGVDSLVGYVLLATFYSLVHSLLEEYYWRWFVFGRLRTLVPVGAAIAVSSVAFAAHHVVLLGVYFGWLSVWTWFFSLAVAVGGAFWAWLYQRSGSLYGPWLSHLVIDAAIFLIGFDLVSDLLT
jgi:membrane protease YdiL (CAAX protease family)